MNVECVIETYISRISSKAAPVCESAGVGLESVVRGLIVDVELDLMAAKAHGAYGHACRVIVGSFACCRELGEVDVFE